MTLGDETPAVPLNKLGDDSDQDYCFRSVTLK